MSYRKKTPRQAKGRTARPATVATRQPLHSSHTESHTCSADIREAIKSACAAFDTNRKRDIVAILEPFLNESQSLSRDSHSLFVRLLAMGFASAGRMVDAEKLCLESVSDEMSPATDFHYVLAFTYASLKEYEKSVKHAESYFAAGLPASSSDKLRALTSGKPYQSQIYNVWGGSLTELRRFEAAETCFAKALEADAKNQLPYLNLANLHIRRKKTSCAKDILEQGIAKCRQVDELRMVLRTLNSRASISACMIVKNEEEMLAGCLESIRDWVDEIIVVDTGSTDRTVAIAESFNAKVFHQPWEGDFSKHRNFSLDQATAEWIFVIDADERFNTEDVSVLQRLLLNEDHNALSISVYNLHKSTEETTTFLPSIRLFRRSTNLRYRGIVHNSLDIPDTMMVHRAHVRMFHHGYDLSPEKMEKKFQRTKSLLESQLAAEPDNAFAHFNYAQILRGDGEGVRIEYAELVLRSAKRAVDLTNPDNRKERSIHLMALNQLAWTYLYLHEYANAIEYCEKALALKSDYLDPLILRGHIYSRMEQYHAAKRYYQEYLDTQSQYDPGKEIDNVIIHHPDSRYIAWYSLAMIAHIEGDHHRSKYCLEKVRLQQKNYLNTNSRLGALLMAEGDIAGAESCFRMQLQFEPQSLSAKLGIAYLHLMAGNLLVSEAAYREVLNTYPTNQTALLKLGYLRLLHGAIDESTNFFSFALANGCDVGEVCGSINEFIGAKQDYERAAEQYERLFETGSRSAAICNEAGGCRFRLGQFEKAEVWFERAREIAPQEPLSLHNLGLVKLRRQNYPEAINAFREFSEKSPSATDVHLILGDLYGRVGDNSSAIQSFEQFLSLNPTNTLALFNLAECYYRLGHHSSALLGYQRVLALDPSSSEARARISDITDSNKSATPVLKTL